MPRAAAPQGDLFLAPIFDPRPALLPNAGKKLTVLVGCSRLKGSRRARAADLYISPRFKTRRAIAETLAVDYFILSAKHGLLSPDQLVAPYDEDLQTWPASARAAWGAKISRQLSSIEGQICILGVPAYAEPIVDHFHGSAKVAAPLTAIDPCHHDAWYQQAFSLAQRMDALRILYEAIAHQRTVRRTFTLSDLGAQRLPGRGVYVFIDRAERNFLGGRGRIVRIGTHAVSEGSKSTLRNRLRNHAGLKDGTGNHRGSIFRLHVGNAMLARDNGTLLSWGDGQDAPAEVRASETTMEQRVSAYLGSLELLILDLDDKPSKHSMRATVERQLISLCSENLLPIDKPSRNWLGSMSPVPLIVKSGLWNLRDVGRVYDPRGAGSVHDLLLSGCL